MAAIAGKGQEVAATDDAETAPPEVSSRDILNIWVHHEDGQGRSYFHNTITKKSQWTLPDGENDWLECKDDQGKSFFHNARNDVSTWEHPSRYGSTNWVECIDKDSGRTFFYNVKERRSVWMRPAGLADDVEVAVSPASHHAATGASSAGRRAYMEESKRSDSRDSQGSDFGLEAPPDGEYHDYILKEGGGTTIFGRKSWKRRFLVLKHGEIGWFKSFKDYVSGAMPLKGRWTSLSVYRLEESLSEGLGVRLLPLSGDSHERVWNLKCESEEKKAKLMDALAPFVATKGFVKNLDRHLSGRRFLGDIH